MFNCGNKEVVFTGSATIVLNIIIQSIIKNGDNVYISPFEHNAVTRVLYHLSAKMNFNIEYLDFDREELVFNPKKIEKQFEHNNPDIVIVSHAINVFGFIAPIYAIANYAKKYGSLVLIDMCQTAGLIKSDLSTLNIDYAWRYGNRKTLPVKIIMSQLLKY